MKKLTEKEFIEKARAIHGDKYDYSKVVYKDAHTKVKIICPKHGEFEQKPSNHLSGTGCPQCRRNSWTTESFIAEARRVHGDKYDYSKTNFKNTRTKVCIICHEEDCNGEEIGEFWQLPLVHLSGAGPHKAVKRGIDEDKWETRTCPICGTEFKVRKKYNKICCSEECRKKYVEKHREEVNKKRGKSVREAYAKKTKEEKYEIVNKVKKTCLERYGKENYSQTEEGRYRCSMNMKVLKQELDKKYKEEILLPKYRAICENDNLELLKFNSRFDCDVRCMKCGTEFKVRTLGYLTPDTTTNRCHVCHPYTQLFGPTVFENTFEAFLKELGVVFYKNYRTAIYPKEIDFYIPDKHVGFELDGLYWHCEEQKPDNYHLDKTNECEEKGIRLIHIFEDEWKDKLEICKSRVRDILNQGIIRVGARKCTIRIVEKGVEKKFLNENHIQGYVASKYCYGLYYNNELLALMSFNGLRKNLGQKQIDGEYELLRFCNKTGYCVQGGASRLLKYFIKTHNPLHIISYADRRWSNGGMYERLGMNFVRNTHPNYFYLIGGVRKNRFGYRKDVLIKKYGCPENMTEREFCKRQRWFRIYDCGTKLYELTFYEKN